MSGWDSPVRWPHLWFHRCDTCNVVTLPFVLRWLDPTHWPYVIGRERRRFIDWWRYR